MPYVHLQLDHYTLVPDCQADIIKAYFVRATMKPKAKGEMNGLQIKPIVQKLSMRACRWNGYISLTIKRPVTCGQVEKTAARQRMAILK